MFMMVRMNQSDGKLLVYSGTPLNLDIFGSPTVYAMFRDVLKYRGIILGAWNREISLHTGESLVHQLSNIWRVDVLRVCSTETVFFFFE